MRLIFGNSGLPVRRTQAGETRIMIWGRRRNPFSLEGQLFTKTSLQGKRKQKKDY